MKPPLSRVAPRCGAKTRAGQPCRRPPAVGKRRCRLHGGAPGSGGPKGQRNGAYRDGGYTGEALAERRWAKELVRRLVKGEGLLTELYRPGALVSENATGTAASKPPPVSAKVTQLGGVESRRAEPPDGDYAEWNRRLQEAFGTASPHFVSASLYQLVKAAKLPGEGVISTVGMSAALALISSLEPEKEVQATLAVHIACLHVASLNVLARTHSIGERNVIAMATAGAKLERVFQTGSRRITGSSVGRPRSSASSGWRCNRALRR
jgi:hypothetical protein